MSARPTGQQLLDLARAHIGEPYVWGAFAPKNDTNWVGPWDCAELGSWLTYQIAGILYGVRSPTADPADRVQADAYTGYWMRDARTRGLAIPVAEAMFMPGAFLLRSPAERRGHIAVSDGLGGTVEAHSTKRGVCASIVHGRVWTTGVLIPGIEYRAEGT